MIWHIANIGKMITMVNHRLNTLGNTLGIHQLTYKSLVITLVNSRQNRVNTWVIV